MIGGLSLGVAGAAGAAVGSAGNLLTSIATNPLVQRTVFYAYAGLTIANTANGDSAPGGLATAATGVGLLSISLAFASASSSAAANGAQPSQGQYASAGGGEGYSPDSRWVGGSYGEMMEASRNLPPLDLEQIAYNRVRVQALEGRLRVLEAEIGRLDRLRSGEAVKLNPRGVIGAGELALVPLRDPALVPLFERWSAELELLLPTVGRCACAVPSPPGPAPDWFSKDHCLILGDRRSKADTPPERVSRFDPAGLLLASAAYLLALLVSKGLLFGLSLLLGRDLSFDQDVVALACGQLALFFTSRTRLPHVEREPGSRAAAFFQTLTCSTFLAVVALLGSTIIVELTGMGGSNEADAGVSKHDRVLALLLNVCIAPISEETFFRALLLGGLLTRLRAYQAVALSALVFSIAHFQLETLLLHAWLGLVLGFGYARWRSLPIVVVSHSIWNLYWTPALHLINWPSV